MMYEQNIYKSRNYFYSLFIFRHIAWEKGTLCVTLLQDSIQLSY